MVIYKRAAIGTVYHDKKDPNKHIELKTQEDYNSFIGDVIAKIVLQEDEAKYIISVGIVFSSGRQVVMCHEQDCCEFVYLHDINGELEDLVGHPLLMFEEVVNDRTGEIGGETQTWTFYKMSTIKGYVTMRWLGTSNGYYSESVDVVEILGKNKQKVL